MDIVADSRFIGRTAYLRELTHRLSLAARSGGDFAVARTEESWPSYRGRALEPLVRQSLERLAPLPGLEAARDFGGYWTRTNDVEVDLVGVADRTRVQHVAAVGSVRWREGATFSIAHEADLRRAATIVPGVDGTTSLLALSPCRFRRRARRDKPARP